MVHVLDTHSEVFYQTINGTVGTSGDLLVWKD